MTSYGHHLARDEMSQEQQSESGLRLFTEPLSKLDCYTFIPQYQSDFSRVLVCVHGVSRNVLEQIQLLRPYAEKYGVALIAPLFTQTGFRDYQRLGRHGHGPRADLALIRILQIIGSTTPLSTDQVALFGFSGGAQFAHRFALAHSQRVQAMILGAAGWYTMPNMSESYPFGTADAKGLDAVRLNVRAAARLPTMVVVGTEDAADNDQELNCSAKVVRLQGPHRLARAKTWVEAMKAYASADGCVADIQLRLLSRIGHSCSDAVRDGGLGELIFDFLDSSADRRISGSTLCPT